MAGILEGVRGRYARADGADYAPINVQHFSSRGKTNIRSNLATNDHARTGRQPFINHPVHKLSSCVPHPGLIASGGSSLAMAWDMKFAPAPIAGAFLISPEPKGDQRGFFARVFCEKEFALQGLETRFVQVNESLSFNRGTLRGMHYQLAPAEEVKIVRCIRGEIYDVILDLRSDSETFGQFFGASLSAENRMMMYVPCGVAHGFISLADNSEIFYLVSNFYAQEYERGVRFDDRRFKIEWPMEPITISDKDRSWPDFDPVFHLRPL